MTKPNPIYQHELRQAQKRTIIQLLALAEEEKREAHSQAPEAVRGAKALLEGRFPEGFKSHHSFDSVEDNVFVTRSEWFVRS